LATIVAATKAKQSSWLGQRRGRGIGVIVIGWLLMYAFETLKLDQLWWWVADSNTAMAQICAKMGFASMGEDESYMRDRLFFETDRSGYEAFKQSKWALRSPLRFRKEVT
jgi:hypothetical protein